MEIRWLEAFIAVAEELHFGNAAIRLRMAKSPLSQVIRKLEHSVGTELFNRNTRSVELTSAGHAFLPHARMVLEDLELARQSVKVPEGVVYGHLSLGFTGVLNQRTLPRFTRAVRDTYPEIELSLVGRVMTQEAIAQLDAGTLDLAFVGLPIDSTRIETQLLLRERFGMVVPTGHPLVDQRHVELSMFSEDHFITPPIGGGSALYDDTIRACTNAGFYPIISQQITDPYMSMMLVATGVGVAYLPEGVRPVVPPGTAFVPLEGEPVYMNHGLAWSKIRGSTAREAFLGLVDEVLAEGL
ncbi:LysR family transcriptional regulator [Enteractinococcus coprophilus]|uniref:LysR family transcriptional regulator n=1 Tax=Enteractinococcus coprophilus TaxID=1027633 RepID=A0A543ANX3_9MICC|nr:LysR family transcriptional regulator [Enteractinococcus coprophilus]TQL74268.1 LysR family transcriptional regulator [Enteractinococcus coprophilus]